MSIQIYFSNKLEQLSGKFSENSRDITDVFSTELIITQSDGMSSWLTLEVSRHNGVFSNYCYDNLNGFVGKVFQMAGLWPDYRYQTGNMRWLIYSQFTNPEFVEQFPHVAQYYHNDDIKRLQLSLKVADLFDQYMLFRQDYIDLWNKGAHPTLEDSPLQDDFYTHEAWQYWMWHRVKECLPGNSPDRVELKKRLLAKLQNSEFKLSLTRKYCRISLFGLSVISDFHKEIFSALAQFMDVRFYLVNPSPNTKWHNTHGDNSNELLENLGLLGKDMISAMMEYDRSVNILGEPSPDSLLKKIQHDIYNNATDSRNVIVPDDLRDGSIQMASSYTPVREVEAMYNYLLNLFERDKSLQPRDVIVQLSDVDLYTPFIKAVFDHAPVTIPYSIVDRSYYGGDTIVGVLDQIMNMWEDDFTSERVVQLLDCRFIRNKFEITDLDFIRDLVNRSNIRMGIRGRTDDDTRYVSWKYGLQRMILGYAIKGGEEYPVDDTSIYPLDFVEGEQAHEMLRFKAFVDTLIQAIETREKDRTLAQWKSYVLEQVLEPMIMVDDESQEEYKYITSHLVGLDYVTDMMPGAISYEVFYQSFSNSLFAQERQSQFITGRVTFCSMMTMRSIPFKAVAMLGVDAGKFPRRDNHPGFDLIPFESRRGDRHMKNNDRYLFLESILAARQWLYVSYLGANVKDNATMPPSLLLEELLDYIESGYHDINGSDDKVNGNIMSVTETLVVRHPLHAFSRKYFQGNPQLFTYLDNGDERIYQSQDQQELVQQHEKGDQQQQVEPDFSTVTINDIIGFCRDPFKFYYNRTLRIYYNEDGSLLSETELFSLDKLQQYHIKMDMVDMDSSCEVDYVSRGKKTGYLPLANMAPVTFDETVQVIQGVREQVLNCTSGYQKEHINIDFLLGETIIQGAVDNVYGCQHLCVNVSKKSSKAKYLIEAWIQHLSLMASGKHIDTLFIAQYLAEPMVLKSDMMSRSQAMDILGRLLAIFKYGHKQIIPFTPNVGLELMAGNPNDPHEIIMALNKIQSEGLPAYNKPYFNEYIKKEIDHGYFTDLGEREQKGALLKELSELLFDVI